MTSHDFPKTSLWLPFDCHPLGASISFQKWEMPLKRMVKTFGGKYHRTRSMDENWGPGPFVGNLHMEVSKNGGTPSSHPFLDGIFQYRPSILGYPHLWKPPYGYMAWITLFQKWGPARPLTKSSFDLTWIEHNRVTRKMKSDLQNWPFSQCNYLTGAVYVGNGGIIQSITLNNHPSNPPATLRFAPATTASYRSDIASFRAPGSPRLWWCAGGILTGGLGAPWYGTHRDDTSWTLGMIDKALKC